MGDSGKGLAPPWLAHTLNNGGDEGCRRAHEGTRSGATQSTPCEQSIRRGNRFERATSFLLTARSSVEATGHLPDDLHVPVSRRPNLRSRPSSKEASMEKQQGTPQR